MDIQRKSQARRRLILRVVFGILGLGAMTWITIFLYGLKPADRSVERGSVWIEAVKRGPMSREVRGLGKLVPEEIRMVTSVTDGRVEKKLLEPGARVDPDTLLVELSNPQLEQDTLNAEWALKTEETILIDKRITLQSQLLSEQAEIKNQQSDYEQSTMEYQAKAQLNKLGLFADLDLAQTKSRSDQSRNRLETARQKLEITKESNEAQLAMQRTKIDQAKAAYALKKNQRDQLKIRAGVSGVLQEISSEIGERVASGAKLAKVANPNKLKAELNIAEAQAKDVQVGQEVTINTRNEYIPGKVTRIDPAVKDGTVTVDVALLAELPKGARPDLSVDGIIVLEKLDNVVYVGHPVQAQQDSQTTLFKLTPDGKRAVRVKVKFGCSAVSTIEVKEGLIPGDQVILSYDPQLDSVDRISLK
jgi:HlyD family secretion protein